MATLITQKNPLMERGAWPALGQKNGQLEVDIDLALAQTEKGTNLAAADIIEALQLAKGTEIAIAGLEVLVALTGASAMTLDLGITGLEVDAYVDGFDLAAAAVGDFAQHPAAASQYVILADNETVDLLIASQTGVVTAGKVRIYANVSDGASLQG